MSDIPSEGPIIDLSPDDIKSLPPSQGTPAPEAAELTPQPPPLPGAAPRITFRGNSYDLAAFGSLISGVIVLGSCLTCNTIYYCLPVLPIILGLIGIVSSNQAVDARRTRTWSWIGIAAGVFFLALVLAAIALYIVFVVLMIYLGNLD